MSGKLSVYTANKVLDKLLRGVDFTPSASYWVAIFTDANDTALRANSIGSTAEVTAAEYQRIEVRGATAITFSASTAASSQNTAVIQFQQAATTWGTATHIALMDSGAKGAGNIIMFGALAIPKSIDSGDLFRIPTGALAVLL